MFACEKKNKEIIKLLLHKGVDVNRKDSNGNNALFYALRYHMDDFYFINLIVQTGIDINFNRGEALRMASRKGAFQVVQLLFKKGIRYEMRSKEGRTALQAACMFNPDPETIDDHLRTIRFLLPYYNIDVKDKYKQSALYHAIDYRNFVLIELLIDAGANINAKSKYDESLLEIALRRFDDGKDKRQLTRILQQAGLSY